MFHTERRTQIWESDVDKTQPLAGSWGIAAGRTAHDHAIAAAGGRGEPTSSLPEPRLLRVSRRLFAAVKGQCQQVQAAQRSKELLNAVAVL